MRRLKTNFLDAVRRSIVNTCYTMQSHNSNNCSSLFLYIFGWLFNDAVSIETQYRIIGRLITVEQLVE
jgi:hypothetical protein